METFRWAGWRDEAKKKCREAELFLLLLYQDPILSNVVIPRTLQRPSKCLI